jgi:hypothetical protein
MHENHHHPRISGGIVSPAPVCGPLLGGLFAVAVALLLWQVLAIETGDGWDALSRSMLSLQVVP